MKRAAIRFLLALTLTACGASEEAPVEGAAEPRPTEAPAAVVPEAVPVEPAEAESPEAEPTSQAAPPATGEDGLGPRLENGPADDGDDREEPVPLGEVENGFGGGTGEGVGHIGQGRIGAGAGPAATPMAPAAPRRRRPPRQSGRAGRSETRAFDIEE